MATEPRGPQSPQDNEVVGYHALTPEEQRARKRRVLATGLALAAFVLLVFLVSMSRFHANLAAGTGG